MMIRIRETQDLVELCLMKNGIECTQDMLGNNGALHYNDETEEHEMSNEEYEWWKEFFTNYEADEEEVAELADEFGIRKSELWERIYKHMDSELDNRHGHIQSELNEIREELLGEQELEELVEVDTLVDELDITEAEIWERIDKSFDGNLETRHYQILNTIKEIRKEHGLEE